MTSQERLLVPVMGGIYQKPAKVKDEGHSRADDESDGDQTQVATKVVTHGRDDMVELDGGENDAALTGKDRKQIRGEQRERMHLQRAEDQEAEEREEAKEHENSIGLLNLALCEDDDDCIEAGSEYYWACPHWVRKWEPIKQETSNNGAAHIHKSAHAAKRRNPTRQHDDGGGSLAQCDEVDRVK